ncbi:MAG: tetratricopeptide repeat protein [Candidatus Peribacteria bacterium]|nr:MAG: tetratricopeptide repeat protein [Candidatus Peribacteria bacterium]
MGKYEEALQYYDQALAIDENFVKALANKAVAMADSGKYQESLAYFDRAIELDPSDYLNYYNKGTVMSDIGYQQIAEGTNT